MSKVEQIGSVYKVTDDSGEEKILFDSFVPVPQPSPTRQSVAETAPVHEEKTEPIPTKNPFSKKHYNLTLQAQLKKRDPEEYQRLKAAAD